MSDPGKQEYIEEFLRKSLLGEEVINTQFHLFSARASLGRVSKPRVLCVNNFLLAKSSKYFLDLLSSDINPSDPSLVDLVDDHDVPSSAPIGDYGYESDSDLEDDDGDDLIPAANVEVSRDRSATTSSCSSEKSSASWSKLSEGGSQSNRSDILGGGPERPGPDRHFSLDKDGLGSVASSNTAVHDTSNDVSTNRNTRRLQLLASRHILVKDTAFQTWYTLLNYLYTGKFNFLPLGSAPHGGQPRESSTSSLDVPRCSAKSMYRLACKVGLDHLRDEAFSYIQKSLTEHNILKELSCTLISRHPKLFEMELDVLFAHIASPSVLTSFPALANRIANNELPHGAAVIVGIHARLVRTRQPPAPKPVAPLPFSVGVRQVLEPEEASAKRDAPRADIAGERRPAVADGCSTLSGSPSYAIGATRSAQAPMPIDTATFGTKSESGKKGTSKGVASMRPITRMY